MKIFIKCLVVTALLGWLVDAYTFNSFNPADYTLNARAWTAGCVAGFMALVAFVVFDLEEDRKRKQQTEPRNTLKNH